MVEKRYWPPEADSFLEYLSVMRGMSGHTVAAYRQDLRQFFAYVTLPLPAVQTADIERFLAQGRSADGDRLAATSQARQLAALKTFFRFLVERKVCAENPAARVNPPKRPATLPKALSGRDMQKLLGAPAGSSPPEMRLRLILQLLYACGMRVSELVGLTLADVAEGDGVVLRVTGKGGKTRLVPLGPVAGATLAGYLREARPHLPGAQGDYLFSGPSGRQPLTRQRMFQLVQEAGERVGLKGLHPHQLRHTFATHLVENDADLRSVQVMLGHASLNTTQVYTQVADRRTRDVLERFHPLGRKAGYRKPDR